VLQKRYRSLCKGKSESPAFFFIFLIVFHMFLLSGNSHGSNIIYGVWRSRDRNCER
jgi:hypothetical protein